MFQLDFEQMQAHVATRGYTNVLTLSHLQTYQQELAEYIVAPRPYGEYYGDATSRLSGGLCWYIRFAPSLASNHMATVDAYAVWNAMFAQEGSVASHWPSTAEDGRTPERLEMAKNLRTELAELIGRLEATQ